MSGAAPSSRPASNQCIPPASAPIPPIKEAMRANARYMPTRSTIPGVGPMKPAVKTVT